MITPARWRSITGRMYLQVKNCEVRLILITSSQLASVVSTSPPTRSMPTLLCKMSTRPNRSTQYATMFWTSLATVTSARKAFASLRSF